jgi:putative ABC transport system permease protein
VVNRMILANVLHRPVRTAVSVLAVAVEVIMVMMVVGLTNGLVQESAKRVEGVGADLLVQPPGASLFLGLTSAPMPLKIGEKLAQIPHVMYVAPSLLQFQTSGGLNQIYGIDLPSFNQVTGGFVYHSGGPFAAPYDVLVDDWYAKANHVKVGQTLSLLNHEFRVAGIIEHGKGARVFIPLETAEDLSGAHDKASIFFVKCTDPGYTNQVVDAIHQLLPKYPTTPIKEYMSLMTSNNMHGLDTFVNAMIAIALGIGFLVIFLSMYTTITERTREIGILKSLGASKGYIINIILREASLLALIGIGLGWLGAVIGKKAFLGAFPTLSIDLTVGWAFRAAVLALAGSVLGAFYPSLRAAQLDPVDALAYE